MGGSAPKTTTQKNTVELGPEQQQLFDTMFPFLQQYAQQPLEMYPGSTIAPPNPLETQAQQMTVNAAMGPGQDLANMVAQSGQFMLSPDILSPDSNPFLKQYGDYMANTMTDAFTQKVLPSIRTGTSATLGPYAGASSPETKRITGASGEFFDALGGSQANLYSQAYGQGLDTMLNANKISPIMQMSQLFPATAVGSVGAQNRAFEQAGLDEASQKWALQNALPLIRAQELMGMLSGMPGGTGVSTVRGAQPSSNPWLSLLGGTAMGAAATGGADAGASTIMQSLPMLLMMMGSDRRIKDVGTVQNDEDMLQQLVTIPVYSFKYKSDVPNAPMRIGIMAQDYKEATGREWLDGNGIMFLDPTDVVFRLLGAVKALTKKVQELEGRQNNV